MLFADEQTNELEQEVARLTVLLRPPPSNPDWRAPKAFGLTAWQNDILRY